MANTTSTGIPTRGKRQSSLFALRQSLDPKLRLGLGTLGIVVLVIGWQLAAVSLGDDAFLFPAPSETLTALSELASSGELWTDLLASLRRIVFGYSLSLVALLK